MRRIRRPIARQIRRDLLQTSRNIQTRDRALEVSQSALGLVIRYFVARFVDASEREVSALAGFSILDAAVDERFVAGGEEFGFVGVVQCLRDGLTTEPIADIIRIAIQQGNSNPTRNNLLQVDQEVGIDEISTLLERVVDVIARARVINRDAKSCKERMSAMSYRSFRL